MADTPNRTAVETLLRTTILALANGASIRDLDDVVRRNASNVSPADIKAGRLGSAVLGDIINTVEQARGKAAFNWSAANPAQITAYLLQHGVDPQRIDALMGRQPRNPEAASGNGEHAQPDQAYAGSLGSIAPHNYSGSSFAAAGLSYSTFDALRAQGFGETNIIHAAEDSRRNGFDPNDKKIASAFAILDKDDGARRAERNTLLERFRKRLQEDEEFQRIKAQASAASNDDEREKFKRQLQDRGRTISKEVGYHGYFDTAPTLRARKAGKLIEHETIKKDAERDIRALAPGNDAKAKETAKIIEAYRRNPDDASVRKDYEALRRAYKADPLKRAAMHKVEEGVTKYGKLETKVIAENDKKAKGNDKIAQESDDLAATLNGDGDTPPKKPATPDNTKLAATHSKRPAHLDRSKVAPAKPAAPVA